MRAAEEAPSQKCTPSRMHTNKNGRRQKCAFPKRELTRCLRCAQQIDEEAVGTGDALGEFAEEGEAGVDVDAFAEVRVDEAAIEIFFAGVVHGEKRRVFGVEVAPVVEAALLHPV